MIPWETLDKARAPEGGELILYRRGGELMIRVDGMELMSSRAHGSEEHMAAAVCARLGSETPRVLVGGLGMGYTLRATLDALPPRGEAVVAEIVPQVVEWNRGPLAHLANRPLDDPRAKVEVADVMALLRATKVRFDAIMLDVDNGPQGLTRKANHALYGPTGLATCKRALKPGGVLAVWSAGPDVAFVKRLAKAGFRAEELVVPARGVGGGPKHTIFLGST
jgi:spermidine synthase